MENSTDSMLSVDELHKTFQKFSTADYLVFSTMLLGCSGIGLYYGMRGKSEQKGSEADEYLLGGRNMKVFPISMSLIASFISGITLLGTPTEMYLHGTEYMFIVFGISMAGFLGSHMVLPVFHDLRLSSTYEYLNLRYDGKVRVIGSVLFFIGLTCWLPIVIYVPALAFNQVTGVNVHIITPLVCLVCIFYTCIGGLKAVVWTDVVQMFLMVGAIFVIIIKGTIDVGGIGEVWRLNWESGRIEVPSFSLNPTIRHSMVSLIIWSTVDWLQNGVANQNMMQRYLTLPSRKLARRALVIFTIGCSSFVLICGYAGLLAYATYHDCDPLTTGLAKAKDQLLPLLVMRVLTGFPGMPGLFVAGVFSAALSSLSTGLNSMSAVVLEDFIKPNRRTPLSDRATRYILRGVVVIFGVFCVALVFVVEQLGSVLQLTITLSAVTSGASFGLFFGGMLLPCLNSKGALWGGVTGLLLSTVFVVGAQRALAIGAVVYLNKMTSVEGCDYTFTAPLAATVVNATVTAASSSTFSLYRLSYLYYTIFGGIITIICSAIISYFTGGNDYKNMDPRFFSPVIRRWLPKPTTTVTAPEEKELLDITPKTNG